MKLSTRFFGELEYEKEDILHFPSGLLGFEECRDFIPIENPDGGGVFRWLQSADRPELAFVVMNPFFIMADYEFDIPDGVVGVLKLKRPEDAQVMAVVRIPDKLSGMTVNLRAPIVINAVNNRAVQVVLEDERYSLRHPVVSTVKDAG
ncbi:MAG: flagellar assembly protein FliW [Clostridiales bacterium]|nr:flagellar assembly protein FliW [Clostridiales bacterium]